MNTKVVVSTKAMMLAIAILSSSFAHGAPPDNFEHRSKSLDAMIQELQELAEQPSAAQPSIESAVDALIRLRSFPPTLEVRKEFNRATENKKLIGTTWRFPTDQYGYTPYIQFLSQGLGRWQKSHRIMPSTFHWLIVPGQIRISYTRGNHFYDMTYEYSLENDKLRLTRNNEVIELSRGKTSQHDGG